MIEKSELIRLVRMAQSERDPKRCEELWRKIREAGLPHDATLVTGEIIGKEKGKDEGRKE